MAFLLWTQVVRVVHMRRATSASSFIDVVIYRKWTLMTVFGLVCWNFDRMKDLIQNAEPSGVRTMALRPILECKMSATPRYFSLLPPTTWHPSEPIWPTPRSSTISTLYANLTSSSCSALCMMVTWRAPRFWRETTGHYTRHSRSPSIRSTSGVRAIAFVWQVQVLCIYLIFISRPDGTLRCQAFSWHCLVSCPPRWCTKHASVHLQT